MTTTSKPSIKSMENKVANFKCKKCRHILFGSNLVVDAHGGQINFSQETASQVTPCERDDGTIWFIREEQLPQWIATQVEENSWIKGKLLCPTCGYRLGSFDFVGGRKCPCGGFILPAIHVIKQKVDYPLQYFPLQVEMPRIQPPSVLIMQQNIGNQEEGASSQTATAYCDEASELSLQDNDFPHLEGKKRSDINKIENEKKNCTSNKTEMPSIKRHLEAPESFKTDTDQLTDELICPVCLEVYFDATSCFPCGHIFCDPCLRNLGRRNPVSTGCPLCRQIIKQCLPHAETRKMVNLNFPHQYKERKLFEQRMAVTNLPLPWKPGFRLRYPRPTSEHINEHFSLTRLLFPPQARDSQSSEFEMMTFSTSSLIVVISLLSVFIITLLGGYACIKYFVVGFLELTAEETQYVILVMFQIFVALVIKWFFKVQIRT